MIALLRAAKRGVTFFDTAEVYGPFTNENSWARSRSVSRPSGDRHEVWIQTRSEEWPSIGVDSRPEHIKEVAEASLKRLRTDVIDLFYQHRVDPEVAIEDVAGAVKELVEQGRSTLRLVRGRSADHSPRTRY
jgi:aryl-alcohol dehydrogenase-like predicted oxidoreductase